MKSGIHPVYTMAEVTCACGNTFMTRSTIAPIRVEICAACHPFYTGVEKLLDAAGRVERFQKRFAKTSGKMIEREKKTAKGIVPKAIAKDKKVLTTAPSTKKDEKPAKKPAKKAA